MRVNGIETGRMHEDIAAVVRLELSMVVVPKVEDLDALREAAQAIAAGEREVGAPQGTIALIAVIDAARHRPLRADPARGAVANDHSGVRSRGLLGGVDLTPDGHELAYARGRLTNAVAAADLAAPIDGPYLQLGDGGDGLLSDSRRSRALGFQGRVALHPDQVPVIAQAFSELSAEQVEAAQRIVDAFELRVDRRSRDPCRGQVRRLSDLPARERS